MQGVGWMYGIIFLSWPRISLIFVSSDIFCLGFSLIHISEFPSLSRSPEIFVFESFLSFFVFFCLFFFILSLLGLFLIFILSFVFF